ncbi:MAG TPA: hypothetical protein H9783_05815 [Candidatus Limosilactobacillus faecipullorum]|nr:hypothetical protein [Candidatus Limosilactobacillus faecipullorum]
MTITTRDWQNEATALVQAMEKVPGIWLVEEHHSNHSESIYLTFAAGMMVNTIRLAFHPAWYGKVDTIVFSQFSSRKARLKAMKQFLPQPHHGTEITYLKMVLLAFVAKANVGSGELLQIDDEIWWRNKLVPPAITQTVQSLIAAGILFVNPKDQRILLTQIGQAILDHYDDFAETDYDNLAWDDNPQIMTTKELFVRFLT